MIRAATMTTAGKQARQRGTIKRQIVHGILEDGMGGRKTINSMIVQPVRREAGMGERETIGDMIVRLVQREAGAGRESSRRNSYIRWECEQAFPNRLDAYRGRAIPMCYYDIDDTGFYDEFGNPIDPSQMDDYLMYGGTDFTVDPEQSQGYYQQPQQGYGQQPQQEEYWVTDEIGNRHKIRGRKNFDDYMNGFF